MSNLGYRFETEVVDYFRTAFPDIEDIYIFRVEGSGRSKNATKTGTASILEGDVSVELAKVGLLEKDILLECKHHKSHTIEKSVSVKKEWVDQALDEAQKNGRMSIVAIKFKGVAPNSLELKKYCWADGKFGNNTHYIIPQHQFIELIQYIKGIKDKNIVDLSQVPTNALFEELKKRLK
jgi:hypothetical protein